MRWHSRNCAASAAVACPEQENCAARVSQSFRDHLQQTHAPPGAHGKTAETRASLPSGRDLSENDGVSPIVYSARRESDGMALSAAEQVLDVLFESSADAAQPLDAALLSEFAESYSALRESARRLEEARARMEELTAPPQFPARCHRETQSVTTEGSA